MMSTMIDFDKESWGVHPVLDVPELFPPAVIFSILDSDPRAQYRETLQRMSEKQNQQALELKPPLTPEIMRRGLVSVAWDTVFHEVPGDRIALLYRNEARQAGSRPVAAYAKAIKSTGPEGTKWLVTRAAQFKGKVVCWCIPVDVEKGKMADVSLTPQNMIVLDLN
jgi:hypothetical protein